MQKGSKLLILGTGLYLLYRSGLLNNAIMAIMSWKKRNPNIFKKDKDFFEVGFKEDFKEIPKEEYIKVNDDKLPFEIYTPTEKPKITLPIGIGWLIHYREPLYNFVKEEGKNLFKNNSKKSLSNEYDMENDPYNFFPLIKDIIKETKKLD